MLFHSSCYDYVPINVGALSINNKDVMSIKTEYTGYNINMAEMEIVNSGCREIPLPSAPLIPPKEVVCSRCTVSIASLINFRHMVQKS